MWAFEYRSMSRLYYLNQYANFFLQNMEGFQWEKKVKILYY